MSLISDLSILTTISEKKLNRLTTLIEAIIAHDALEAFNNNKTCSIDLGYGTLNFIFEGDEIIFKFIPSQSLEKELQNCINNGVSPIDTLACKKIDKKIMSTYKDFI